MNNTEIDIKQNIKYINEKINIIAKNYNRDPKQISLLAVSKNKSIEMIQSAIEAGQISFGENYAQEGLKKIRFFYNKPFPKLTWHFIGSLQSNKSKIIAEHFDWCHTVDRKHLIFRLNKQRPVSLMPLNILIQIHINNKEIRSCISSENFLQLAEIVADCTKLKLRGLMAIPVLETDFYHQLQNFNKVSYLFRKLKKFYSNVDTLSIGTTDDMPAAIAAGSTMLRIGKAIFGCRKA